MRARCLFATHYHELSALREKFQGIESYYAASRKTNDGILFLYTIIKGVADGSFGVEVAKIAELPAPIIERAQELLKELTCHAPNAALFIPAQPVLQVQQEIEQLRKHIQHLETMVRMIQELNMETISSRQALDLLWQLKESLNISKQ